MPVLRSVWSGIRALLHKKERDREIDEELQGYFHAAVDDQLRSVGERLAHIEERTTDQLHTLERIEDIMRENRHK